jgi:hypothetical protein
MNHVARLATVEASLSAAGSNASLSIATIASHFAVDFGS